MNFDLAFKIAFAFSAVGWLLLFIFPKKRSINFWLCGTIIPIAIGIFYTLLCALYWFSAPGGFFERFGSLNGMLSMFQASQGLLLAGYVHYLAFDIFIGAWEARRATVAGWSHWLILPCLVLTLLFGPTGLVLFEVIAFLRGQHVPEDEAPPRRGGYTGSALLP